MEMSRAEHHRFVARLETTRGNAPRPAAVYQEFGFRLAMMCPVLVYALPRFQTTLEEDAVLLILFIYWLLRTLNGNRAGISPSWLAVGNAAVLGWIYGLGWIGLLRGYEDAAGRGLVLFPALLAAAAWFRPPPQTEASREYRRVTAVLGALTLALYFLVAALYRNANPVVWDSGILAATSITPKLILLPILGCAVLMARSCAPPVRGRDHLPLLGLLAFATLCSWSGNARTWYLWYVAGEQERAWTPYKYDAPEDIAEAERKPFEAAMSYHAVLQRIFQKGDLPQFLNWPFYLRYRMAYQAMRKNAGAAGSAFLPISTEWDCDQIRLIKNLWHLEYLGAARGGEPDYSKEGRIWVDAEFSPDETSVYLLDRFGRVYSPHGTGLVLEWEPGCDFTNAVDLEISPSGGFIVVRGDGMLLISRTDPLFPAAQIPVPLEGGILDLEFFPGHEGALVVNARGESWIMGKSPDGFPPTPTLRFDKPVIADMEIDPDGQGYYLLDIYGAVHSNHPGEPPTFPHTSPPVPQTLIPYWAGSGMALDLELDPMERGLYVYNRLGEVFSIAAKPYWNTYRPPRAYPFRGIALLVKKDGFLTALESNGNLVTLPSPP